MPPLHFALAGYGRVAPTHIDAIKHLGPEAQLLALCDINPDALKSGTDATGAKGYGALDDMLDKSASYYEEQVDNAVDNLTALMEPMIMSVLGVLVGGLIIAMYLPIFQLGNVVGG